MARQCAKCRQPIPTWAWVEGRKRNLQRRRYCLTCSPFGEHNTRRAGEKRRNQLAGLLCRRCGDPLSDSQRKGRVCWKCLYADRAAARLDRAYKLVGEACWRCGYTKGAAGRRVLDFHHVNPESKCFPLDCRHIINRSWTAVFSEMSKCVLLCANCHREVHAGLVGVTEINGLHAAHWPAVFGDVDTN